MDRRVSYRVLQQALLEGRDAGVWRFQIACRMRGVGGDIGYLVIGWPTNLPGPVKPLQPEPWGLFITMTTEGDEATYLVRETDHPVTWLKPPALDPGKEGPTQGEGPDTQETAKVRSLTEVSTLVGKAVDKNAGLGLVLKCPGDISLQRFIDLYNVAVKSGCKHILLMKPEQEEADQ